MSVFEFFQPGLRFLREEKDRQRMLVVRPSVGGRGPLGIDLDSGEASFSMPTKPDAPADEAPPDSADETPAKPGHD